jgi:hypothetical protein
MLYSERIIVLCFGLQGVSGNAAKSGIKAGDTIIYASSFFGDELWPADKLSFTQTAIQRAPSPVCFVYVSVSNSSLIEGDWTCMPEQKFFNPLGTAQLANIGNAAATAAGTAASQPCGLMLSFTFSS